MRVLFATPHYYPEVQFGGPPRKIHALSRGLARRGHAVSVVTLHSGQPRLRELREVDGIPVQYLSWIGHGTRQFPLSLSCLRQQVALAEIVHLYGLYNMICPIAGYFARQYGRPVVTEPLGMYSPKGRNQMAKRCYHRLFTHRLLRRSAAVIAASEGEMIELSSVVDERALVLRRNGIDVEEFTALPDPIEFRNAFKIGPAERVVLFLGRISPIKNIELLVRAFASARLPNARLVLAGPVSESDYVRRVQALIQTLGMSDQVTLIGPIYDRMKLASFAAADLFVLPSLSESFGNAAAEAVAAGVPVLITETCGIAKLIHGRAGLAVPASQEAVADGLRTMMHGDRAHYTARRSEVAAELDWDEPLNETEELYHRLIDASSPKATLSASDGERGWG